MPDRNHLHTCLKPASMPAGVSRLPYCAPRLIVMGQAATLTRSGFDGTFSDASNFSTASVSAS